MSLNDKDVTLHGAKGADVYDGVSNPTKSSVSADPLAMNFVDDPTNPEMGAGAGSNFRGWKDAKASIREGAGVVEARPGIIEKAHIAPLDDDEINKAASLE